MYRQRLFEEIAERATRAEKRLNNFYEKSYEAAKEGKHTFIDLGEIYRSILSEFGNDFDSQTQREILNTHLKLNEPYLKPGSIKDVEISDIFSEILRSHIAICGTRKLSPMIDLQAAYALAVDIKNGKQPIDIADAIDLGPTDIHY